MAYLWTSLPWRWTELPMLAMMRYLDGLLLISGLVELAVLRPEEGTMSGPSQSCLHSHPSDVFRAPWG